MIANHDLTLSSIPTGSSALSDPALEDVLPQLHGLRLEERVGDLYRRYRAIHAGSGSSVWVHYFGEIAPETHDGIYRSLNRMSRIHDSGLIRPRGYQPHQGNLILITEAIEGTPLDQLIDEADPVAAECWANDLSSILGRLHEAGEVHGHLTPQAIYQTEDGMKVLGAGMSDLWAPVWAAMRSAGRINPRSFLAPEILLDGIQSATATADVYSLGAILFRTYTGYAPSEYALVPSLRADVSSHVDRTVMMALNTDPSCRQASMKEFIERFYFSPTPVAEQEDQGPKAPLVVGPRVEPRRIDGRGAWIGTAFWWGGLACVLIVLGWMGLDGITIDESARRDREGTGGHLEFLGGPPVGANGGQIAPGSIQLAGSEPVAEVPFDSGSGTRLGIQVVSMILFLWMQSLAEDGSPSTAGR